MQTLDRSGRMEPDLRRRARTWRWVMSWPLTAGCRRAG